MSILFIILAAFFSAVMDAVENEPNFHESIFNGLNERFWLKSVSWQYAKKIGNYKIDCWHLSKSLMIICLALSIALHETLMAWWAEVLIAGVLWNGTFVLFYHKIFKVK